RYGTSSDKTTVKVSDQFDIKIFMPPDKDWFTYKLLGKVETLAIFAYGWLDYCDSLNILRRDPFCWVFQRSQTGRWWSFRCAGKTLRNIPAIPTKESRCR